MNKNVLENVVFNHKNNEAVGFYSACTANEIVIRTVIKHSKKNNSIAVIEATANQCNQFGGYTGMTPKDFKNLVLTIAKEEAFDFDMIHLGGDHLGPLIWKDLPEEEAMSLAKDLVYEYVIAGFTKIHLDTSMKLKGDEGHLSDAVIARRSAELAQVCSRAYSDLLKKDPTAVEPVYIIGSEVPVPGGVLEEETLQVTDVEALKNTLSVFEDEYTKHNVQGILERVIAVVVQPGVEFGDAGIDEYNRAEAKPLMAYLEEIDYIYEGHSTDYQTQKCLSEMVEDGVKILKVGPGLTFALREALIALGHIETELYKYSEEKTSDIINVLEKTMMDEPKYWEPYYTGNENEQYIKRIYSFSDRIRYYLPNIKIQESVTLLLENLNKVNIPITLISQYMPIQYNEIRANKITYTPEQLLESKIFETLDIYMKATRQDLMK